MLWVLRPPSQLAVVQGLGQALGLAAGWGWAGAAQVAAGWAAEGRAVVEMVAEGRACRHHLRGIMRTVIAWPVTTRLTGILQWRLVIDSIAALAPEYPAGCPCVMKVQVMARRRNWPAAAHDWLPTVPSADFAQWVR